MKRFMNDNPGLHNRKSIRLPEYDYSLGGAYFITICTKDRINHFGEMVDGELKLSASGGLAKQYWEAIPSQSSDVELDAYVLMPNHIHGILIITESRGLIHQTLPNIPAAESQKWILQHNPKTTLGKIIRAYKAKTSKLIHDSGLLDFMWQRNYYEHIARNEDALNKIREYITNNPLKWQLDIENPEILQDTERRNLVLKDEEGFWNNLKKEGFDKSNPYKDHTP